LSTPTELGYLYPNEYAFFLQTRPKRKLSPAQLTQNVDSRTTYNSHIGPGVQRMRDVGADQQSGTVDETTCDLGSHPSPIVDRQL
jgi:hypothetical protein